MIPNGATPPGTATGDEGSSGRPRPDREKSRAKVLDPCSFAPMGGGLSPGFQRHDLRSFRGA